jgi:predicted hotdog family 3-hydroxylacyl-ACP dehydratase
MNPLPPVAELVPHAGDMMLLDEVLSCEGDTLSARATVRPCPFSQADGSLPPWLGLEFMAQAVSAWAGWQARQAGKPVRLGFLLGTRHYECRVDALPAGASLSIHVTRTLQDDLGMGVFHSRLLDGDREIAEARLNVYQPADTARYTQEGDSA